MNRFISDVEWYLFTHGWECCSEDPVIWTYARIHVYLRMNHVDVFIPGHPYGYSHFITSDSDVKTILEYLEEIKINGSVHLGDL